MKPGTVSALDLELHAPVLPTSFRCVVAHQRFCIALALRGQAGAINAAPHMAGSASGLTGFMQMAFSAVAAQAVALIFNGTVYPMLVLMLVASAISLLSFRLLVPVDESTDSAH